MRGRRAWRGAGAAAWGLLCVLAAVPQAWAQPQGQSSVQPLPVPGQTLAQAASPVASTVSLQGTLGQQALLVIDGKALRTVPVGDTHLGIKVISVQSGQAVVQVQGQRRTLRVGDTPVSVQAAHAQATGHAVVLRADGRGHFMGRAHIGQGMVSFMVDTGASLVAIGQAEADRLRLDYRRGATVAMRTANGLVQGWLIRLPSVRLGDVTVYEVDAVVLPTTLPHILLGNSFLSRFRMQREGVYMTLTRR